MNMASDDEITSIKSKTSRKQQRAEFGQNNPITLMNQSCSIVICYKCEDPYKFKYHET